VKPPDQAGSGGKPPARLGVLISGMNVSRGAVRLATVATGKPSAPNPPQPKVAKTLPADLPATVRSAARGPALSLAAEPSQACRNPFAITSDPKRPGAYRFRLTNRTPNGG